MLNAKVAILEPQRIKESDKHKREKRIYEFVMTLSESEIQLVRKVLSLKSKIEFIRYAMTLSEIETQFVKKLLSIYCHQPTKNTGLCEVVHLHAMSASTTPK